MPLQSQMFQVNYAKVEAIAEMLAIGRKWHFYQRVRAIGFDRRTNTLIVQDTQPPH